MKKVFLDDKEIKDDLFPLTLTRSAADIRVGIFTIREKWKMFAGADPLNIDEHTAAAGGADVVASNFIPSGSFLKSWRESAQPDQSSGKTIRYPWDIFTLNDWALREDFNLIKSTRVSEPIPESVQVRNARDVFIDSGAQLSYCIINAEAGPVYIGRNAQVMEGSMLRGPLAICEGAVVKMGSRLYGATTIGPFSIVGGEIKNSVIQGYSNKAHDGYLGDSVIGEWCNIGAGTSNSNMKNNVSEVKMWSNGMQQYISTGLTKCGLIMGDFSRAAINTSFNTGTMVGICANVFGAEAVPKFVPSFAWGNTGGKYEFEKAINDIQKWKKLKGHELGEKEKTTLRLIFDR